MGNNKQQIEWLANVDLCRRMAERLTEPELRGKWLKLAQDWLTLCAPAPEHEPAPKLPTAEERFETELHYRGTGQVRSESPN
jgi:hypothetical protein